MRVEILGDERRRRWSDESKLEVVLSVGVDGASVTEVARRYLADVLDRIQDQKINRLAELLPWNWKPTAAIICAEAA